MTTLIKSWYAIYTRPRWEKKVANLLERKSIEVYCPLNRVLKKWSDRNKLVAEPLFKSYVFVHVKNEEMLPVLQTDGVLNFVNWLKKPAVIRDDEIEIIRDLLKEHTDVKVEKIDVRVDDRIRIERGPLSNLEGHVREVNNYKVKVMLPTLGYMMVAEVFRSNIKVLNP
jgi:transcription antitermination factor NusG